MQYSILSNRFYVFGIMMTKPHKKRLLENPKAFENHRGDVIRTRDLYVPNVALYQTEPHPGMLFTLYYHTIIASKCQDFSPD